MYAHQYAEALFLAEQAAPNETERERRLERFVELLASRGHNKLLLRIIAAYQALARRRLRQELCVRVVRKEDAEQYATRIAADIATLGVANTETPRLEIDERIVGGYEVRSQGARIDRTYRRTLITLYSHLVSSSLN